MADRPWRSGIAAVAVWAAAALPVSAQRGPVMPAYPAWFLDPPAGAASVAVPRYATAASSFAEARDSVREALGRIAHVRVRMTQRATQVEGVPLDLEPEQVRELVRDVPDSVVVLDSTIVGQMTFMLGAASARLLPGLGGAAVVPPAASPGWVTNPPAGLAGVGTAPVYVNEHTSWAEAEQRARGGGVCGHDPGAGIHPGAERRRGGVADVGRAGRPGRRARSGAVARSALGACARTGGVGPAVVVTRPRRGLVQQDGGRRG
ncbi:MAG: hypothetical protein LW922_13145 [Gemmatimonadetes bacterium]|jgi:hypothetical protein|nr:hypothetical protein [Gemmatimonadota bacterium]